MTLDEIVREMQRKPDAQLLVEWIGDRIDDPAGELRSQIGAATDAYFRALEG